MTRAALFLALIPCAALGQSDSRQQALRKQLAEDVESHSTLVNDPAVVHYVNRIAQNLLQTAERQQPLTVKVITGDTAYAFPGASCYVNAGLILKAESEAELAGVIAHLLGHIVFWRTTPVEIAPGTQIPIVFAAVCARLGGAFAMPTTFANGQAVPEAQSDQAGLEYLAKAGYYPEALADFFERILSGPRRRSSFYSWAKFPASTRAQADSLRDQRSDFLVTTSGFHDIQERVTSLIAKLTPPTSVVPTLNPVKHFH